MHWFRWWREGHHYRRHHHPHPRVTVWLVADNFAVELKPNMEIEMAQNLADNQIDNLAIAAADAAGNPVTPTFDSPPQWTLTDTAASGAGLTASADGTTAVLTPGKVGDTVTVNLSAVIGGKTFSATLDVTFVGGAVASISIVPTPAPKP